MIQKVIFLAAIAGLILLAALVGLLSGTSASHIDWKQCSPTSTKVNSVSVSDCDPIRSTVERCALKKDSYHFVEIDFVQPRHMQKPRIRYQLDENSWNDSEGSRAGLACPSEAGQAQHLKKLVHFDRHSTDSEPNLNLVVTMRENGSSIDKPDLCVEIPVLLF